MNLPRGIKRVATRELSLERHLISQKFKRIDPAHAVLRADQQLKSSIRDLTRAPELIVERTVDLIRFINRRWRPPCSGNIRSRVRRQVFRIDVHSARTVLKTTLQEARC